jgi:hypothetical protein
MADYFDTLNELRLDLMLIPRADRYFNKCKSNLKFLEASMLEVPTICQGFSTGDSPYQHNPEDGKYMEIAYTNDDWLRLVDIFVKDKEIRREAGKLARQYVLKNYNIEDKIHLWQEAYEGIK